MNKFLKSLSKNFLKINYNNGLILNFFFKIENKYIYVLQHLQTFYNQLLVNYNYSKKN